MSTFVRAVDRNILHTKDKSESHGHVVCDTKMTLGKIIPCVFFVIMVVIIAGCVCCE